MKKKYIRNQVEAENFCTIIKNLIWYKVLQYETSFFDKARYSQGNAILHFYKTIHFSINIWSNLNSNYIFGQLVKFCVQNCPWMLNLVKNEGSYEGFNVQMCSFFHLVLKFKADIQFFPHFLFCLVTASNLVNS